MKLQDPRNMQLDDIRKVLQHCYGLQAELGPGSSFRFALFLGPKRKRLFANYPDTPNNRPAESVPNPPKKKDKGKQRTAQLEGLLQMQQSEEPSISDQAKIANHQHDDQSAAGPSNNQIQNTADPNPTPESVRITMGQMIQLKDMGYKVLGPVNGPNEGYPEYQVPKATFKKLKLIPTTPNAPTELIDANLPSIAIDPVLLLQDPNERPQINNGTHTTFILQDKGTDQTSQPPFPTQLASNSDIRPITPPNLSAGSNEPSERTQQTPKTRLGKRAQANLSPQAKPQAQSKSKKKKVTDDDRAALEAQDMVRPGSKCVRKATKKR